MANRGFVPGYSGGTVLVLHQLPISSYKGTFPEWIKCINKFPGCQEKEERESLIKKYLRATWKRRILDQKKVLIISVDMIFLHLPFSPNMLLKKPLTSRYIPLTLRQGKKRETRKSKKSKDILEKNSFPIDDLCRENPKLIMGR